MIRLFRYASEEAMALKTKRQLMRRYDDRDLKEEWTKTTEVVMDAGGLQKNLTYGKYILAKYIKRNSVPDEDMTDALCYFLEQVNEVIEDPEIKPEERKFHDVLVKIKEDLAFDPNYYEPLAEKILPVIKESLIDDPPENPGLDWDYLASLYLTDDLRERMYKAVSSEPSRLYKYLDQYVIGQKAAKKTLATAVYGHLKRIRHTNEKFIPDAVLLVGPSGCGKTELVRRLVDAVDLPCVFTDVSGLSASQYASKRTREDILMELYNKAGGDLKKAESGIIFLDEFDKLLVPSYTSEGVDSHEEVQGQLLTVVEGSKIVIQDSPRIEFDTSRVLFIMAGAFEGLEDFILESKQKNGEIDGGIGFDSTLYKEADTRYTAENITHDVLIRYGMQREFAGRIGSITVVKQLSREDLSRILTEPKGNIFERYSSEVEVSCGGELCISERLKERLIDEAVEMNVGARGLSIVMRSYMKDVLYEAPEHKGVSKVSLDLDNDKVTVKWIEGSHE